MILGIITARGGSRRVPLKNIKLLGGKPLIAYSIEAAHSSNLLDRLIVSSDHPEIISIAKQYGAEVPFVRPKELAEEVPSELVVQHAVNYMEEIEKMAVDIVVAIQPTTPFIKGVDIDACINLVKNNGFDSSFSCRLITEPPQWMFRKLPNGGGEPFIAGSIKGNRGIFQELEELYIPNGGIYVTKKDALFRENVLITKKVGLYVMPHERSVDIDEQMDFLFAEFLLTYS